MGDLFGEQPAPEQPESDDPRKEIFHLAVRVAEQTGRKEESVRKQIASMLRQYKPLAVLGALQRSMGAADPLTYARRLLNGKRPGGDGAQAFLRGGR